MQNLIEKVQELKSLVTRGDKASLVREANKVAKIMSDENYALVLERIGSSEDPIRDLGDIVQELKEDMRELA